jgi:hypothetical protein
MSLADLRPAFPGLGFEHRAGLLVSLANPIIGRMQPFALPRSKQCLVTALLFGFVWQMGACPCGCLDHNLWLRILCPVANPTDVVDVAATDTVVSGHDCDHQPRDPYLCGRKSGEDTKSTLELAHPAAPAFSQLTTYCSTTTSGHLSGRRLERAMRALFIDAQEMRAHLQIFLI